MAMHKAPRKYYQFLVLLAVAQRLYDGQLLVEPCKNIDPPNGGEGNKVGCVHITSPILIGHGSSFSQSYCFFRFAWQVCSMGNMPMPPLCALGMAAVMRPYC